MALNPRAGVPVVESLELFNRKERFFVVCAATDAPSLRPGPAFRGRVEGKFGLTITDPVFMAVDYHQDWLIAALLLAHGEIAERQPYPDPTGLITGNQQDVDILLAFGGVNTTHLVLLEAKAYTGFTNKAMLSMAKHLKAVFGAMGNRFPLVTPHFGLLPPRRPT